MTDRVYTSVEVAEELGISRQRVAVVARARGLGQPPAPPRRSVWLFTRGDIQAMRERRPGRPKIEPER